MAHPGSVTLSFRIDRVHAACSACDARAILLPETFTGWAAGHWLPRVVLVKFSINGAPATWRPVVRRPQRGR